MTTDFASFAVALGLGFFSSTHCLAMCGGIMGALTMAVGEAGRAKKIRILIAYNMGRITSYCVMGALAGLFAKQLMALGAGPVLRLLAAALLVAMALYLTDVWRGLTRLETAGQWLWRGLQPLGKRLLPVRNEGAALALGGLWGWLPCGLVYTALSYAMTQPGAFAGASVMLGFGLGTLPAVLLAASIAEPVVRVVRSRGARAAAALVLVLFAAWTAYGALAGHSGHHGESANQAQDATNHHHHH
ncbi:sulfite exporter TauE/SafE family protein [Gilvimarinus sp. SDUM040013]|uniref:Sulfite exporter TauE/SafE family protein n=1 Tax=Gilvimarinus gilvus TaxID=3058038 RepID=A0ABU4RV26_9GAMM|nr:sulfite exporter TauE/SafE family protein [Gilvimarinus sp. SDUM040013]MDO3387108.1 sulfite exporter TauE/SafE family protein [Gilvimarinus sp. SDUM040013]MDX6847997.1 sulfite exporter TauE/SafE family protein [Gilvimarinus sp. SDUM040013]